MSVISKAQLKDDFLDGKVITEPNMADLIDSCYNSNPELLTVDRTFVKSEILSWHTTPVQFLPSIGATECYIVEDAIWIYDFVGDSYTASMLAVIGVDFVGLSSYQVASYSSAAWRDSFTNTLVESSLGQLGFSEGFGKGLVVTTRGAAPITATSGATDGTMRLILQYYIKDYSAYWPVP